jgi:hypothetical protein
VRNVNAPLTGFGLRASLTPALGRQIKSLAEQPKGLDILSPFMMRVHSMRVNEKRFGLARARHYFFMNMNGESISS